MQKTYRKGAIGALTDEYEKALDELKTLLIKIPDDHSKKHITKRQIRTFNL